MGIKDELEGSKEDFLEQDICKRGKILQVRGSKTYRVEFDLRNMNSFCTCPYGRNCKHGVAAFLAYSNGEFFDGDAFLESLKEKGKEEIPKKQSGNSV